MNHGGPDKAVCVYSADHYADWRIELGLPEMHFGAFGENFTIGGLAEDDVCIGDIWRVGEATVQVSQPRQPCWKLAPLAAQRPSRPGSSRAAGPGGISGSSKEGSSSPACRSRLSIARSPTGPSSGPTGSCTKRSLIRPR